jgi:hypothetical protein
MATANTVMAISFRRRGVHTGGSLRISLHPAIPYPGFQEHAAGTFDVVPDAPGCRVHSRLAVPVHGLLELECLRQNLEAFAAIQSKHL